MGLTDRLRRRGAAQHGVRAGVRAVPGAPATPAAPAGGYAVVDVQTTGPSPVRDRIVEVAIVGVDTSGRVSGEWSSLVHPPGADVGSSSVHGLVAADVEAAPPFSALAADVVDRLAGRVVVAHGAPFEVAFLRAELERAGVQVPYLPSLCTLAESWRHLPRLRRRRLSDCCAPLGIALAGGSTALRDARAAAALLGTYLDAGLDADLDLAQEVAWAVQTPWPRVTTPRHPAVARSATRPLGRAAAGRIGELLDRLPLDSVDLPLPRAAAYLELLAQVLAVGVATEADADALAVLAVDIPREDVLTSHRCVLRALAHAAAADGPVTAAERNGLLRTARVLGVGGGEVSAALETGGAAREAALGAAARPLAADWAHGEPLHVGQSVAFTGGDGRERARLEDRAVLAGLRLAATVSPETVALVTDDPSIRTPKGIAARELGTRVVDPATFAALVAAVQPAVAARPRAAAAAGDRAQAGPATSGPAQAGPATSGPPQATAGSAPAGSAPAGSAPAGSAPGGGRRHGRDAAAADAVAAPRADRAVRHEAAPAARVRVRQHAVEAAPPAGRVVVRSAGRAVVATTTVGDGRRPGSDADPLAPRGAASPRERAGQPVIDLREPPVATSTGVSVIAVPVEAVRVPVSAGPALVAPPSARRGTRAV